MIWSPLTIARLIVRTCEDMSITGLPLREAEKAADDIRDALKAPTHLAAGWVRCDCEALSHWSTIARRCGREQNALVYEAIAAVRALAAEEIERRAA